MLALSAVAPTVTAARPAAYFLSVQDGRAGLDDGRSVVRTARDTLAVIELADGHLRVTQQIEMPTSLVGPPTSVAVSPDSRMALVTAATRRDEADPGKVVPSDVVSVVSLDPGRRAEPRVVATLHAGAGASGVSINRAGTLALVANRVEGSVSVLSLQGERVAVVGKLALGEKAGPAHAAFTPDGRHALVTRDGDSRVTLLKVDGTEVTRVTDLFAGTRPYGLDVSPSGEWAVVTNLGGLRGDVDTISLIGLRGDATRVVDTVSVGQTPESIFFSPDGGSVGVTVIDGGSRPKASPFHGTARFRLFRVAGGRLEPAGERVGGEWLQGFTFAADGTEMLVQDAANRVVMLYRREGAEIVDTGERLAFDGAPCAIRPWP